MNVAWARLLLESLRQAGAESAVVSPGSRSAPLAWAAAEIGLPLHVAIDERAAAFFALGRARVTGAPAILICTSGTAGAHYYPAVIEASLANLPLIAVTADRPPELHGCGANQTVEQQRMFGEHARYFADLGLPSARQDALLGLRRRAAQAVAAALGPPAGPVHLNVPARKPLEPGPGDAEIEPAVASAMAAPLCRRLVPPPVPSAEAIAELAAELAGARVLIAAGPAGIGQERARAAVSALAARGAMPLYAEATSQLRFAGADRGAGSFDLFELGGARLELEPDAVLELGAVPASAGYAAFLAARPGLRRFAIAPAGWPDPHGTAALLLSADPGETAALLARALPPPSAAQRDFAAAAAAAEGRARSGLARALAGAPPLSELAAVATVLGALPERALLGLGNSSPVRLADLVGGETARLRVWSQRGASGIDGLVAGAAGAASAAGGPSALLCGDVSFAHDIGGLALARQVGSPLALVVLDNGGGRLFEQLPIAAAARAAGQAQRFSELFLTPPRLDLAAACAAFGVGYARAESREALAHAVRKATARPGTTLIHALPRGSTAELLAAARRHTGELP